MRKAFLICLSFVVLFILNFSLQKAYAAGPCSGDASNCVIQTAIGPISTNPAEFTKTLFGIVLGVSGGIAIILIIMAGYRYMTSQGNPESIKAANEQLTSAIIGLLFIIFSFVILQVIGVNILHIPGFG